MTEAERHSIAMTSVLSCLVSELTKSGALDFGAFMENVQGTAAAHRASGDPKSLAGAIHRISEHLLKSVPSGPSGGGSQV